MLGRRSALHQNSGQLKAGNDILKKDIKRNYCTTLHANRNELNAKNGKRPLTPTTAFLRHSILIVAVYFVLGFEIQFSWNSNAFWSFC